MSTTGSSRERVADRYYVCQSEVQLAERTFQEVPARLNLKLVEKDLWIDRRRKCAGEDGVGALVFASGHDDAPRG